MKRIKTGCSYDRKKKRRSKSTSLRRWPTDWHASMEPLSLLSRFFPRVSRVTRFATSRSFANSLKSIPAVSLTRLCIVSLLQGFSRHISTPCMESLHLFQQICYKETNLKKKCHHSSNTSARELSASKIIIKLSS